MRKRAANFTKQEVVALLFLIRKYKDQIDSKFMTTNSHKVKDQAWHKISQEFNSLPETRGKPRNAFTLRMKYSNLKKQYRKIKLRKENSQKVASVNSKLSGNEIAAGEVAIKEEISCEDSERETNEKNVSITSVSTPQDFESVHSTESNSPISSNTQAIQNKQSSEDILELQKRCLLEEHKRKLQHMQEKHERALRIQEEAAAERLRQIREEHELQMEILRQRKQFLFK